MGYHKGGWPIWKTNTNYALIFEVVISKSTVLLYSKSTHRSDERLKLPFIDSHRAEWHT